MMKAIWIALACATAVLTVVASSRYGEKPALASAATP